MLDITVIAGCPSCDANTYTTLERENHYITCSGCRKLFFVRGLTEEELSAILEAAMGDERTVIDIWRTTNDGGPNPPEEDVFSVSPGKFWGIPKQDGSPQ